MEKLEINILQLQGKVTDEYAMQKDKQKAFAIFAGSVVLGIITTLLQVLA